MSVIEVFADGACKGNPGIGGWGAIIRLGVHEKEIYGAEQHTTNNRMELMSAIKALDMIKIPSSVKVYSDSQYVVRGISEWISGWKRRGWKTADGSPVKNVELWQQLDALTEKHQVEWQWVKGHAGHPGNERADALANKGITELRASQP